MRKSIRQCMRLGALGFVRRRLFGAICGSTLILGCGAARSADMIVKAPPPPPVPVYSAWRYDITPYAWMPSLNGSSTIKGHTTDVDASFFGDIIHRKIPEQLFGLMTAFEARNDRFAILGDFVYMKLGASKGGARSETIDRIATLGVSANFDASFKMIITELAAAYEVARWGSPAGSATSIDLFGGGRLWWQQAEASLDASAALAIRLPRQAFNINGARAVANSRLGMSKLKTASTPKLKNAERIQ